MEANIIFIVGSSRSGTTMLGRILGNHSAVFTFHELHFFEQIWIPNSYNQTINKEEAIMIFSSLINIQRIGFFKKRINIQFIKESSVFFNNIKNNQFTYPEVFELFLKYETINNKKSIACEQTPLNIFYADEILKLFPKAKLVNLIRDPRDVLLSQKNKWLGNFNDIPFTEKIRLYINYHPLLISKLWQSSVLKSLKFRNHERFYSLKFEDLLLQPQEAIYNLCKFLGINYDINMLDIPHISSSFQKDNFTTRGINTTPVFRWKNGGLRDEEIYFSQKLNTNLIKSFNYNLKNDISISKFVLAYYYFIFPIKLFFSLILNFRRSRNIINSVIRRFF